MRPACSCSLGRSGPGCWGRGAEEPPREGRIRSITPHPGRFAHVASSYSPMGPWNLLLESQKTEGPEGRESCWRVSTTAIFEDCEEATLGADRTILIFRRAERPAEAYLEDIRGGRRGSPLIASPRSRRVWAPSGWKSDNLIWLTLSAAWRWSDGGGYHGTIVM